MSWISKLARNLSYWRNLGKERHSPLIYFLFSLNSIAGYAAYELSKSLSELAKKQLARKSIGEQDYSHLMAEALRHLDEAVHIMAFDPKDTFYGELANSASKEREELRRIVEELK